jgi:hypothetical protein
LVQELSDRSLPPELRAYFGIDASVLNADVPNVPFSDIPYWVGIAIILSGVIASIGLCFGKRWGRTLYLLTFVAAVVSTLLTEFYVSTRWTALIAYLVSTTEGMILGLAYFSHVRRMFEPSEAV